MIRLRPRARKMSRRNRRRGRDVDGILLLDKPAGVSSNGALQQVKRFYNANKAGHTGSLDVPATGLLPICLGAATRISAWLLNADKTYLARCKLGLVTTTGDAAGEIVERRAVPRITETDLRRTLSQFTGEIEQTPPMYSALKHNGRRLYEFAYQGIEVGRKPRPITVHSLDLLEFAADEFELRAHCSKGTYIRVLAQDIGRALGSGAHVLRLRRIAAGLFSEAQMITLEALAHRSSQGMAALDDLLLPMDRALADYPAVRLSRGLSRALFQGRAVPAPGLPGAGTARLYDDLGRFIGLGVVNGDGRLAPGRLIGRLIK